MSPVTKQIVQEAKEAAAQELEQVMTQLLLAREEAEALPDGTKKLLALKKAHHGHPRAACSPAHTGARLLVGVHEGSC